MNLVISEQNENQKNCKRYYCKIENIIIERKDNDTLINIQTNFKNFSLRLDHKVINQANESIINSMNQKSTLLINFCYINNMITEISEAFKNYTEENIIFEEKKDWKESINIKTVKGR